MMSKWALVTLLVLDLDVIQNKIPTIKQQCKVDCV